MRTLPRFAATAALLAIATTASAQVASFTDLPAGHQAYDAVQYLASRGILKGYDDGSFRPDQKVTRAEALKMIVTSTDVSQLPDNNSGFVDVPADAWYDPFAAYAAETLNIINDPTTSPEFRGASNVTKAEFLKMFLLAQKENPSGAYAEISLPLSTDAQDVTAWYYPFMRFAISSSMIMVQADGTLNPSQGLTRAQVALLMNRYFMYKQGRRTQALLSACETDLVNVLKMLEEQSLDQTKFASARALVTARGALTASPDAPIVQGAVKTAEAFRSLVRGYDAGSRGEFEEAIRLSKEAWTLADKAKEKSTALADLSAQIQTIAANLADTARESQAGTTPQ